MPKWLWKPTLKKMPDHEPTPKEYRCCCGCCTSQCGFTFLTCLMVIGTILSMAATVAVLFYRAPITYSYLSMVNAVISILMTLMALLARSTLRPIFMQLCWLVMLFNYGVGVVNIVHGLIVALNMNGQSIQINGYLYTYRSDPVWIGGIAGGMGLIMLVIGLWILTCAYSFYRYIRDRQYYLENRGSGGGAKNFTVTDVLPDYRRTVQILANGTIIYVSKVYVETICDLKLGKFPFDHQDCPIRFIVNSYPEFLVTASGMLEPFDVPNTTVRLKQIVSIENSNLKNYQSV
ncbi:unnamed protein product, partial [Mesorhabditis belari]|uniref:Neurotransmitter-gated ion-channel ligand-binding domain-containing protein n=1 Tax=Mesorhabditis belari TaxID=2138241 RepID=A0AAF3J955_9BILA